jgi:hypothetical protein
MRSKSFDKNIFEMAKKYFPHWIGFDSLDVLTILSFQIEYLELKKMRNGDFKN